MSTNFPTGLDTFIDPGPTTLETQHAEMHDEENDGIVALQTYVGTNPVQSGDTSSLTYKVGALQSAVQYQMPSPSGSSTTDTAAFNSLLAAIKASPSGKGNIVFQPASTANPYLLGNTNEIQTRGIGIQGPGSGSCFISATNTGPIFSVHDHGFYTDANFVPVAGKIGGFTMLGSGAPAGAVGLEYGDSEYSTIDDLVVISFQGSSVGVHFNNIVPSAYCEKLTANITAIQCDVGIQFDQNSGIAAGIAGASFAATAGSGATTSVTMAVPNAASIHVGDYVTVSGAAGFATPANANGTWPVTAQTASTITFTTTSAPGAGTGTANMTWATGVVSGSVSGTTVTLGLTSVNNMYVGDSVTVAGIGGLTGVAGTFAITSVNPTTNAITYTASSPSGTFTSGGTVVDMRAASSSSFSYCKFKFNFYQTGGEDGVQLINGTRLLGCDTNITGNFVNGTLGANPGCVLRLTGSAVGSDGSTNSSMTGMGRIFIAVEADVPQLNVTGLTAATTSTPITISYSNASSQITMNVGDQIKFAATPGTTFAALGTSTAYAVTAVGSGNFQIANAIATAGTQTGLSVACSPGHAAHSTIQFGAVTNTIIASGSMEFLVGGGGKPFAVSNAGSLSSGTVNSPITWFSPVGTITGDNNLLYKYTRTSSITVQNGEFTVFTGSTPSQTLTLPGTSAQNGCVNTILNSASVPVSVAPPAGTTLNNFGTVGTITLPVGAVIQVVLTGTVWYVIDSNLNAPTPTTGDNSTRIATTAFVQAKGATRTSTITVAPSNAPANVLASADYVCAGSGDEVTISTAIAALPSGGGEIKLLAGNYSRNGPIICDRSNVTLTGEGIGTYIQRQASGAASSAAFLCGFRPITTTVTISTTPSTIVLGGGIGSFSGGGGTAYVYATPGGSALAVTYTGVSGNTLTGCTAAGSTVMTAGTAVVGTANWTSVVLRDFILDGNYANNSDSEVGVWSSCTSFQATHVTSKSHRGDGWYLQPYDDFQNSVAIYESLLDNCYGAANGGQQVHIGTGVDNGELIRVYAVGASSASPSSPTRGLNGFHIEGGGIKLVACHPYFNIGDGLHTTSTAASTQVIGGEYETNQGWGINMVAGTRLHSVGTHFYGNTTGSFQAGSGASMFALEDFEIYLIGTSTSKNILISGCSNAKFRLRGNMNCSGASSLVRGISVESSTSNGEIDVEFTSMPTNTGNIFDVGISNSTTITVRGHLENGVIEASGADKNLIDVMRDLAGATFLITTVGANTKVRSNPSFPTISTGEATISAGTNASVIVTHGLGFGGAVPIRVYLSVHGGFAGATAYDWTLITGTSGGSTQTLPVTTFTMSGAPSNFPTSGVIAVSNGTSTQYIAYTGVSGSTFTGCTGGTGTIAAGATVTSASAFNIVLVGTNSSNVLVDWRALLFDE